MEASDWASAARIAEYREDPEHQQAINILESVLLAKESPSDAAKAITATYEAYIPDPGRHGIIGVFWSILCDATRACGGTDAQANRLTDLVIAIQGLPDITDSSGVPAKYVYGGVFWRDLPGWRITFREYGIYIETAADFEPEEWPWREQKTPLLNATTFAATLMARASFVTGMAFHACGALSCALSDAAGDPEQHQLAELHMPAAATWILIAGHKLREACVTRYDARHVYEFYPERWTEWKHRFEAISIDLGFEQESRDWAARAARRIATNGVE